MRLLYSVLHGDKRFLSSPIRILIKEKNLDLDTEQDHKQSISSNSISNEQISEIASQSLSRSEIQKVERSSNFSLNSQSSTIHHTKRSKRPSKTSNQTNKY